MYHNQNNIGYAVAPNGVNHQHTQQNPAAVNSNSFGIIYSACNQGNLFYTVDPNLTAYQPIDYYDSPFSESTYDFSHLSPAYSDPSLTEEPAIFDYWSGDEGSCSPYDDHVSTPSTEDLYPSIFQDIIGQDNVCIVDPSDPVTANMHVPLTFNGDPNLLIINKEEAPLSPIRKLTSIAEEDPDELIGLKFEEKVDSHNQEALYQMFGLGSPLSVAEDVDDDDDELEEEDDDKTVDEEVSDEEASEQDELIEEEEVKPAKSRKRKAEHSSADTSSNTKKRKKPDTKDFKCPHCPHSSKRKYNLATHIKTHDKERVKEFTCPQCQKGFDRRHDRNRHLATVHRLERAHACKHCPAHFSRGDALNRHLIQKHGYDEGFED